MKKIILFLVSLSSSIVIFGQFKSALNLESADAIKNWVTTRKFKSEVTSGYTLSIETVNNDPVLFFSAADGHKKQFSNLKYTSGTTTAMIIGQGEGDNSLEVRVLETGDLMVAGMVFKPE